jgi:Domain of unknown function (DUF4266)
MISPASLAGRIALAAAAMVASAGCVEVAPYDRARLAHPTMVASDIVSPGEAHVRAIHEGAAGGNGAAGSGCGCN